MIKKIATTQTALSMFETNKAKAKNKVVDLGAPFEIWIEEGGTVRIQALGSDLNMYEMAITPKEAIIVTPLEAVIDPEPEVVFTSADEELGE